MVDARALIEKYKTSGDPDALFGFKEELSTMPPKEKKLLAAELLAGELAEVPLVVNSELPAEVATADSVLPESQTATPDLLQPTATAEPIEDDIPTEKIYSSTNLAKTDEPHRMTPVVADTVLVDQEPKTIDTYEDGRKVEVPEIPVVPVTTPEVVPTEAVESVEVISEDVSLADDQIVQQIAVVPEVVAADQAEAAGEKGETPAENPVEAASGYDSFVRGGDDSSGRVDAFSAAQLEEQFGSKG